MSALAYIDIDDVPVKLRESSVQQPDDITGETLIAFDGCPLVGQIWRHQRVHDGSDATDVIYPFPRAEQIRNDLVAWLMHWGINFTVVM
jgi:hypothetical protein